MKEHFCVGQIVTAVVPVEKSVMKWTVPVARLHWKTRWKHLDCHQQFYYFQMCVRLLLRYCYQSSSVRWADANQSICWSVANHNNRSKRINVGADCRGCYAEATVAKWWQCYVSNNSTECAVLGDFRCSGPSGISSHSNNSNLMTTAGRYQHQKIFWNSHIADIIA